ncbi:sugar transferase [Saccharibacillus sp. CPCC 101409]|uniref:sugar transferase n=1 Tax=Saccharibacillus sp. CPCC 101409 TaxID=3058041 RepID=UPI00267256F5|nr:sugar transferase [Saccharibacillus sp. CPCC 101409]MDO3412017.1 sugar transferase [Saccharibacillus sp. CPCC 101409]
MYRGVKAFFDPAAALLLIVLLSPLLLIVAVSIRLESSGPVFFMQRRLGQSGRFFTILKFRTMRVGTPELATDLIEEPCRYLTRIGGLLRRTSLDELPQLINILRGEMSFVGPRPSLYNQYWLNEKRIGLGIVEAKPGLTGYAQVLGRDSINDILKLEYDLFYVRNMSFCLDARILVQTFGSVIRGVNIKG